MTTETIFAPFAYFFSDFPYLIGGIAFCIVFVLIILYYTNRE